MRLPERFVGVVVTVVLMLGNKAIAAADGPPERTDPAMVSEVAAECAKVLSPLIDPQVFAGVGGRGSPADMLALHQKWWTLGLFDFTAPRQDLERVLYIGDRIRICRYFDDRGYPLAESWKSDQVWKITWWVHDPDDPACLIEHKKYLTSGKDVSDRFCARLHEDGSVLILSSSDDRQVPSHDIATMRLDTDSGRITLESRWDLHHNETVIFDARGLPVEYRSRPCYDRDQPCPDLWDVSKLTFDSRGNLVARETRFLDGERQADRIVNHLNERGDWYAWHFANYTHPNQIDRQDIIYRDP